MLPNHRRVVFSQRGSLSGLFVLYESFYASQQVVRVQVNHYLNFSEVLITEIMTSSLILSHTFILIKDHNQTLS